MSTLKIKDENGKWVNFPTVKGDKGDKGEAGTTNYNELENKPDLTVYATKEYVNELLGGIENGSY